MLNYSNIATIINNQIMKNATGDNSGVLIAEDLSNLVEVAKVIDTNNTVDLRNAFKNLVVGVHNFVLAREIETKSFRLLRDAIAYGGGLQRILASGLFDAQESHLLNLVNGQSYLDGKFYGMDISSAVIEETKTFKVVTSRAEDFYRTWFTNASDLSDYLNLIAITERNTIRYEIAQLEKRVIVMAVTQAIEGGRTINFMAMFNSMEGRTVTPTDSAPATLTNNVKWTVAELKKYREEWAYFGSFVWECIARLSDYVKEPNRKYNDGTVLTYAPSEKIGVVLLSQFASDIEYLGKPVEFNPTSNVAFDTISTWQNLGTTMLPDYTTSAEIKIVNGESTNTYENVVGVVYDVDGVGITAVADKVTYEDVGAEGFVNLHHHIANKYYIDKRLASIALVLE